MKIISRTLIALVGILLISSAILKLIFPSDVKIAENMLVNNLLSILLIQIEFILGFGLIFRPTKKILTSGLILIFVFTFYTLIKFLAGSQADCGCFGYVIKRNIQESIGQDLILLIVYFSAIVLFEKAKHKKLT